MIISKSAHNNLPVVALEANDTKVGIYSSGLAISEASKSSQAQASDINLYSGPLDDDSITTLTAEKLNLLYDGEYEKKGVFISAFSRDVAAESGNEGEVKKAERQLIEVEAEGVRVLYLAFCEQVSKEMLNELGVIDVLIMEIDEAKSGQSVQKIVNDIDPKIFIPVYSKTENFEKLKGELGMHFSDEKKYKCKSADFMAEEYVVAGVNLV